MAMLPVRRLFLPAVLLGLLLGVILPSVRGQTYNLRDMTHTVVEGPDAHVIVVLLRTGDVSQATGVLVSTIAGTAQETADYVRLNFTREFMVNFKTVTVRVDITDDGVYEQMPETFRVRLSDPSAGTIGPRNEALITIIDDDAQFSFDRSTYPDVSEGANSVFITLSRTAGNIKKQVVVYISTTSCSPCTDYVPLVDYPVNFPSGEDFVQFEVIIMNDQIAEMTESFDVRIASLDLGGTTGQFPTTTVTILDDDVEYSIVSSSLRAKETSGGVNLNVLISRQFNTLAASTIEVFTEDGTATITDGDYQGLFSVRPFVSRQSEISVSLTINDDNVYEPNEETFFVGIRNPSEGTVLSTASRVPVVIEDNESVFSLVQSSYTVRESEGPLLVGVQRIGDLSRGSRVRMRTIAVSANENEDFTPFDLELSFAVDQARVDREVVIFNDGAAEDDETFTVELYQAAISILDSSASTATITIQDAAGLSTLVIVLIVVAAVIVFIIIIVVLLCCCLCLRSNKPRDAMYYDREPRHDESSEDLSQAPTRRAYVHEPRHLEPRPDAPSVDFSQAHTRRTLDREPRHDELSVDFSQAPTRRAYDREPRHEEPILAFPQEPTRRARHGPAIVTYVADDEDLYGNRRERYLAGGAGDGDRMGHQEIRGFASNNPRLLSQHVPTDHNAPEHRPPSPPSLERAIERSNTQRPDATERFEQPDPRRTRSMFAKSGDREPFYARDRQSHHASTNEYF